MHNCRWTARPHEVPPGGHPFGLWKSWAAVLGWDVQRRGSGHERTFGGDLRSPEASGRAEGYGGGGRALAEEPGPPLPHFP